MDNRITRINIQITELKYKLKATDYKCLKFVDGELSENEYQEVKTKRKQWRAEINALEERLKEIK